MSKLYLTADTDMIRTTHTARANKYIDLKLGYDEKDYSKKIKTWLERDGNKLKLIIADNVSKKMIVCNGTVENGIKDCKIF